MSMPCPLDGKCIYNTYPTTAKHVCALPCCIYPDEQRRALIRAITALAVKPHRNPVEEGRLQRYRAYLRELWGGGP